MEKDQNIELCNFQAILKTHYVFRRIRRTSLFLFMRSLQGDNQQDDGTSYKVELERLLHKYEPGNEASATQLLETYAGMEHELIECYRHYYAGKGSFRVALDDTQETAAGSPRASPLQLPTSAIGTYLQAKLQSRRSGAARNAKLEDVRGPTTAVSIDNPNRSRPAAVAPRRRATSFTARLQHDNGDVNSSEDEDELNRRASTPSQFQTIRSEANV